MLLIPIYCEEKKEGFNTMVVWLQKLEYYLDRKSSFSDDIFKSCVLQL